MKPLKLPDIPLDASKEPLRNHPYSPKLYSFKKIPNLVQSKSLLLNRVKRTKQIVMKFSPEQEKNSKDAYRVINKITRSNHIIKVLSLNIDVSNKKTNNDLSHLRNSLKRLKNLQKMDLHVAAYQITKTAFSLFMKGLGRLFSLKKISFTLSSSPELATSIDLSCMSRSLRKLVFLKDIDLDLSNFYWPIEGGLQKLLSIFNRLPRLEKIYQSLPSLCSDIKKETKESIQLKRLAFFGKFFLNFGDCSHITASGIRSLAKVIKGLPNLQNLQLWFCDGQHLDTWALKYIWKMINGLPSLRVLDLYFSNWFGITDGVFDTMNETLKDLPLLQKLRLEFPHCKKITDNGILRVCQALKRCPSLKTLGVSFSGCHKITDHCVEHLVDCIKNMVQLRSIDLNLACCKGITDRTFSHMIKYLKTQSSLEEVNLCLEDTNVTVEGACNYDREMDELIKQKPNLRSN